MSTVSSFVPDIDNLAEIPKDADGAVFAAPWEAKAFALVIHLHQRGCFAWQDWVDVLASEIAADKARPAPAPYYLLWLAAAERIMTACGLVDPGALVAAQAALQAGQLAPTGHHDHAHDHGDHAHPH